MLVLAVCEVDLECDEESGCCEGYASELKDNKIRSPRNGRFGKEIRTRPLKNPISVLVLGA